MGSEKYEETPDSDGVRSPLGGIRHQPVGLGKTYLPLGQELAGDGGFRDHGGGYLSL